MPDALCAGVVQWHVGLQQLPQDCRRAISAALCSAVADVFGGLFVAHPTAAWNGSKGDLGIGGHAVQYQVE